MPLEQEDFRGRRCGESNGASGGYGSFSVYSGGPPKAFWRTFLLCFMKASSVIDSCFLLGRENPPILAHIILFSTFAQVQKALDVSLLFCLFLTNSTSLLMFLCPRYSGVYKRHWLGEWSSQKAFMKETKPPQDKAGGTRSFPDWDSDCRASWVLWHSPSSFSS